MCKIIIQGGVICTLYIKKLLFLHKIDKIHLNCFIFAQLPLTQLFSFEGFSSNLNLLLFRKLKLVSSSLFLLEQLIYSLPLPSQKLTFLVNFLFNNFISLRKIKSLLYYIKKFEFLSLLLARHFTRSMEDVIGVSRNTLKTST